MLLYIIRHGETAYNAEGRLQGCLEISLNENGKALAEVTGKGLKGTHFDLAISSPLRRAYETTEIILRESDNLQTPIITEDRIKEISFGEWEGLCCSPANNEVPSKDFHLFFEDPFLLPPFPNGENVAMVCERTGAFYQELIKKEEFQNKTILISTHGCAMRALLRQVYEDKTKFWHTHVPYNCAVNIVEVIDGKSTLLADDKIFYDPNLCIDRYK